MRRVPVRVQALFVWQLAAIVERGIGWLTRDYKASLAAGLEALLCVGFLGGAYASGNAAPAVAVLLLRDCGAAALHLSRLVQQAASRVANWAFSSGRAAGGAAANTIALLTRSGGWLAFAVLRVVNMLCILYSLLAERPPAFATPRPEDIQAVACLGGMIVVDLWALDPLGLRLIQQETARQIAADERKRAKLE